MAAALIFYTPAAFDGTIAVEVAPKDSAVAADMVPLYDGGSAVALGAARAERRNVNGFEAIRLNSSGTETAERVVEVYAVLDIANS